MNYAGIGRRKINRFIRDLMFSIGYSCAKNGMVLRSGAAEGSDTAFEKGAMYFIKETSGSYNLMEIYLPWAGFGNRKIGNPYIDYSKINHKKQDLINSLVAENHPNSSKLGRSRPLIERNCMQILGKNLDVPVDFVVCYTDSGQFDGGTGFAKKIAKKYGINIIDLYYPESINKMLEVVSENTPWVFDFVSHKFGDIRNEKSAILMNGVNCKNKMGSGLAKSYYEKWPKVKESYHTVQDMKLGMVQSVQVDSDIFVMNAWTQNDYGRDNKKYANSFAIKECIEKTIIYARNIGMKRICVPLIGCGLGGLDWQTEVYPFILQLAYLNRDIKIEIIHNEN